ncbi:MAG: MBL fold metallo-hydrolase [Clostridia bacterium]|nr:MBL fold metallo-hydrolase [Clostridia bacterium]MDD4376150.1 MBL fold metallo-hydrolase [Clostridia bacterium]
MKVTFLGAAQKVTGSCTMVEACGKKFLVDCGMFQGTLTEQLLNYEEFPFDIKEIDFVILTHAHIDHSGRIPKLYANGYNRPIYATKATTDLCTIMLADSGHIQEKEIEWVNRKRMRAGKTPTEAMYTAQDGLMSVSLFKSVKYDDILEPAEGIKFKMRDAGHMLGSAIVEIWINEDGKTKKIVFTGDLGNKNTPIIRDPEIIEEADILVIESTYGGRYHGEMKEQSIELMSMFIETIERGGNVVIPSFAVGRTQEIIYEINKFVEKNENYLEKLARIPVYVDSPLAINATKVFENNPDCYNDEALQYLLKGDNPLAFKNLFFVKTADESRALNEDTTPKIIISASGMCEVGRIKHHLKWNLWRPESTVLFVGYQAEGTLGRRIRDGQSIVKIFGEEIGVNAEIRTLDAFSGHADQDGLIKWIKNIKKKPKKIFLIHGEHTGQLMLKSEIEEKLKIECIVPEIEDSYVIDNNLEYEKDKLNLKYMSTRFEVLELLSELKEDVDTMTNVVKSNIKQNIEEEELTGLRERLINLKDIIGKVK